MSCIIKKPDCPLKTGDVQCGKCGLRPNDKFASREDRDEAVQKAEQLYSLNHAREASVSEAASKIEPQPNVPPVALEKQPEIVTGTLAKKAGVPGWAWGVGGVVLTIAVFMMMGKQPSTPTPVVPAPLPAPVAAETAHKITLAPVAVAPVVEAAPRTSSFADPFAGEMVTIPAGSFGMSSNSIGDKPVHTVTISRAFELGKTEVTQGQWRALMGNNPSKFKSCGDSCPVESVSWDDVQNFIKKLNDKTGKQYRLPTEAEWEYSCRAGGKKTYCGSDNIDAVAWYEKNGKTTHVVAGKKANAFGLYDMSGNVMEWTQDCSHYFSHSYYNGAPDDGSEWKGNCDEANSRMLRSGSWFEESDSMSSIARYMADPSTRDASFGFRLARTLP